MLTKERAEHGELDVEARLTRVEAITESIASELQSLTSIIRDQVSKTDNRLIAVSSQLAELSRTSWPTIFAGVSIIVSFGALLALGNAAWIGRVEKTVDDTAAVARSHSVLDAHPTQVARMEHLSSKLESTDLLAREHQLIDGHPTLVQRAKENASDLTLLRGWQLSALEQRAGMLEQIRALEREVFKGDNK